MAQFHAENERVKRRYLAWLREAEGKDEKTLDQVAASIRDFEMALGCKPFKAFHLDWARRYKRHLEEARNHRTGKPLSLTTRDARLRHVKAFFKWLAAQPGYKSRITFADVAYFNNNAKDARAAHAKRPREYPSMEQCAHAFRMMPEGTTIKRRNKAIFALLMLTAARDSALASLRLCDVDLVEGVLFQDGRYVDTKNSKTFETWFLPLDPMYRAFFEAWVAFLREDQLFGPTDPLFAKPRRDYLNGQFSYSRLSRQPYPDGKMVNEIIKKAFLSFGLHPYTPHSFRSTLTIYGDSLCETREAFKAWSQNIGHENAATTIGSYLPVPRERQRELIRGLSGRG
jgi:integrase